MFSMYRRVFSPLVQCPVPLGLSVVLGVLLWNSQWILTCLFGNFATHHVSHHVPLENNGCKVLPSMLGKLFRFLVGMSYKYLWQLLQISKEVSSGGMWTLSEA
ncbi:hypothetical protein CBR_g46253 [Chara braunii]|uniref:Uncharacterized protein n=1 Tax=Chara braunii TaxID=69332 RepID=A0A388K3S9_CHABU|nr:hypothetical protein CBR_g46253 [Chara braunii]|eukprot:GBG64710.1 hypothetical protein CBR_g46253 [Chara braunii]